MAVDDINGRHRGKKSRDFVTDSAWMRRMNGTWDGTVEPVSRDQILRPERGQLLLLFSSH